MSTCGENLGWRMWAWLALGVAGMAAEPYRLAIPRGLDEFVPIPEDNPLTVEKVQLGKRLFFDRGLSRDGTVSCGTCHVPTQMFTVRQPSGMGVGGQAGRRNVPSLFNRAYQRSFYWDGRETSLEQQVLQPIQDPHEMDLTLAELERRLNAPVAMRSKGTVVIPTAMARTVPVGDGDDRRSRAEAETAPAEPSYADQFRETFGEPPSAQNAAKALASYVRALVYGDSPFDRFQQGETAALSDAARRGLQIFRGKGNCTSCHSGPLLSDEEFHNTGVGWGTRPLDLGRFEISGRETDRGKFKTPSLRDVALTAPYMHNGQLATLAEVIEFYSRGGNPNPNLDREIRVVSLTGEEKRDLEEFLKALSGRP